MIKEYYADQTIQTTINVEDAQIKAYKSKNITRKSVRVFDPDKKIFALAAGVGEVTEADLEAKAKDLLSLEMKYEYELERNKQGHYVKGSGDAPIATSSNPDLESFTQKLLSDLSDISKHYVLTGWCSIYQLRHSLKNTLNLDLSREQQYISCDLEMKLKGSGNIMDASTEIRGFTITDQQYADFLQNTELIAKACMSDTVTLEDKDYRVLFQCYGILRKFYDDVVATTYEPGTSLLAGKQGQQIFHPSINIVEAHDNDDFIVYNPYDDEGVIREKELPIVENGVLKTILYDKKQAAKYGKTSTGSGFRSYNSNPRVDTRVFIFKDRTNDDLPLQGISHKASDIIADDIVIIPIISSGGDFLPNGNYSKPIQLALVYKNGKFIGKAPQLTLTGNYLDSFNKDFISVCRNDILSELMSKQLVYANAKVSVN